MVAFFVIFLLFVGKGWTLDWKIVNPIARLSHDPYNPESIGSNAVDGIIPSNTGGSGWRKCAVSKGWSNPEALTIVLRRDYWISSVKVHLRETSRAKWQNGLRIYIGNQLGNDKQFTQCGGMYTYRGHSHPVFKCDPPLQGKLIHLIKFPNQFPYAGIQVCEVEVRAGFPCHHLPDNFEIINSTGSHYHDTAYFKCTTGYHPKKPQLFKCESNRQWEPMESLVPCKPVDCGKPSAPINGYIEGRDFEFKSKVNYMCNDGYRREGAGEAQCMANGNWSLPPPLCQQLTCSLLKPLNGRFIVRGTTIGSTVTVICNPGYEIKNESQKAGTGPTEMTFECRQCSTQNDATAEWTQSGHLSLASLECQAKNCSTLPDIQQGGIFYTPSTLYGSKAGYECKDDYEMKDGDWVRFCKEDGKWNGTEPYCEHKCSSVECPLYRDCRVVNHTATCQCFSKETCSSDYDPKCGDDGRTYNNECLMKVSGCKHGNPNIQVAQDGECKYSGVCLTDKPAPPERNPCRGFFPRYYFDFVTGSCKKFIFGGCFEGNNSFISEDDCSRTCQTDPCGFSLDRGLCKGEERRWHYNKEKGKCQEFEYSGCFGNENNFVTNEKCKQKCVGRSQCCKQTVKTEKEVCSSHLIVVLVKIVNLAKTAPGSEVYEVKITRVFKGNKFGDLQEKKRLKISRKEECANVDCPRLKINKEYCIGSEVYKDGKFNDVYYIEKLPKKSKKTYSDKMESFEQSCRKKR
eukprot:m.242357 g.242357  ORF g.242357 m.242357 type:complete len:741 (+) comp40218_c1_seq43:378-2600(+)